MSEGLLTKMSLKSCNLFNVSGGVVDITQYDVAASLSYGNLNEPAYQLARAKFLNDYKSISWLRIHFIKIANKIIKQNQLSYTEERAQGIADLTIREGIFGMDCRTCDGRGVVYSNDPTIGSVNSCIKCNGTGAGRLSERERSRVARVPYTTWNRKWKEMMTEVVHYVNDLENQIIRHIKSQLRH